MQSSKDESLLSQWTRLHTLSPPTGPYKESDVVGMDCWPAVWADHAAGGGCAGR